MADMTKSTMDKWLPEVWSKLANVTYRSNTVIVPLLDHRWEPEVGVGKGDTVNIPGFTQNQASDVTTRSVFGTGGSLTWNANTEGQTQLLIDQMEIDAYRMPVEMSLQAMTNYDMLLVEGIGQALALKVDSKIASDGTNGYDAFTAIGADNVDVTDDVILEGETNLNNVNAPLNGRYFVMSPATRASLMQIDVIRNQWYANTVGNLPGDKGAGYMGKLYTLDCYMSNNLESGTAGIKNFIGQTECIAYASQQEVKIVKDLNIEDGLFNQVVGYMVYGFIQVKSTFGREVDGKEIRRLLTVVSGSVPPLLFQKIYPIIGCSLMHKNTRGKSVNVWNGRVLR